MAVIIANQEFKPFSNKTLKKVTTFTYIQTACLVSSAAISIFAWGASSPSFTLHFSLSFRAISSLESLATLAERFSEDGIGVLAIKVSKVALSVLGFVAVVQGLPYLILTSMFMELVLQLFQVVRRAYEENEKGVLLSSLNLIGGVLTLAARIGGGHLPFVVVTAFWGLFNGVSFYLSETSDFEDNRRLYKANTLSYLALMLVSFANLSKRDVQRA